MASCNNYCYIKLDFHLWWDGEAKEININVKRKRLEALGESKMQEDLKSFMIKEALRCIAWFSRGVKEFPAT